MAIEEIDEDNDDGHGRNSDYLKNDGDDQPSDLGWCFDTVEVNEDVFLVVQGWLQTKLMEG